MYKLCINWANQLASKFDPSKYQFIHLLWNKNIDNNKQLAKIETSLRVNKNAHLQKHNYFVFFS